VVETSALEETFMINKLMLRSLAQQIGLCKNVAVSCENPIDRHEVPSRCCLNRYCVCLRVRSVIQRGGCLDGCTTQAKLLVGLAPIVFVNVARPILTHRIALLSFQLEQRASTCLNMDRRAAFGAFAGAAAVVAGVPQIASADGAVSGASILKARQIYGGRILELKSAVDSGNFDAITSEKTAFVLFNSGAYPTAKDKASKKAAIAGTNAIFAAAKAGDKAALASAYKSYVAANDIKGLPTVSKNSGQGYSSDFDYRRGTSAGAVYVR
jgi:Photosystem II Psb31 protein